MEGFFWLFLFGLELFSALFVHIYSTLLDGNEVMR